MKSLQEECILGMTKNLRHPRIGPYVRKMHRSLKTLLLECVIWHDALDERTNSYIVNAEFFRNLTDLRIPKNNVITDYFMNMVAASGCQLRTVSLVVPLIKHEEKWAPLSGKGIRALFADQEELEDLKLVWCINFKADVITRIRSDHLRKVDIAGDAVCRCFEHNISLRDKVHLCQRDFGFLALNNPTITELRLDGIILDLNDCYVMFKALAETLRRLEIKIVRFYAFCQKNHCFYGRDFVPFLEFVDRTCHRLEYLSCFVLQTDVQDKQIKFENLALRTLCLEGHVFQMPVILPVYLEKIKLSINGYETVEHYSSLQSRAPKLSKIYANFVDDFTLMNEDSLLYLFTNLGGRISSLTNINASFFRQISSLICEFCPNLKELSIVRPQGSAGLQSSSTTGLYLLPMFQDFDRAAKLTHLHLGLENLSQSLLSALAENCRNLKTLDLAYCRTLDDMILTKITENCGKTLKILDISLCNGITDDGILVVAQTCPNLEEIMLFQTKIGDKAALALALRCTKLKFCGVNPEQISKEATEILCEKCVHKILM